jgi:hypothetical protein
LIVASPRADYLERAISNDAKNATAHLWQSIHWSDLGFIQNAIDEVNRCLEIEPRYENCRRHLAMYRLLEGNISQGLALYQESAEIGFRGSEHFFMRGLMATGNRLAVALSLWSWQQDDRSFPVVTLLDALEFPDRDLSEGLVKFLSWLEKKGEEPEDWSNVLLWLGGYEHAGPYDYNDPWIWLAANRPFRQSPYFKPLVRELGLPAYWHEKGFPPMCRPLGEEDFECD